MHPLTPRQLAWRLAQDLPATYALGFGAGLPQLLHEFCPPPASSKVGRPIDLMVLTADEVSATGHYCCSGPLPMLVAREVWIVAALIRDDGSPVLVDHCSGATQGSTVATRLYTDVAIFDLREGKVFVRAMIEGITLQTLQMELDVELHIPRDLMLMQIPLALGGSY